MRSKLCCLTLLLSGAVYPQQPAVSSDNFAFMSQPNSFYYFQHMDQLGFRLDPVSKGARVYPLKEPVGSFSAEYTWEGKRYSLDDYFQRSFVLGFLILHNNQIVLEKYFHDANQDSRFLSNSVAKSIVSVMIGNALEEKKIRSVDDPVVVYLPYLDSSGYQDVTIKNLLQMASGVKFDEVYLNPESEIGRFGAALLQGGQSFREFAASIKPKIKPGTKFEYQSVNTEVLGLLLEQVTGHPLHQYIEEQLWKKIGPEKDAFLYRGKKQVDECAFGCFNATVRDYGRFGLMAMHGGKLNGQRVVSEEWMHESTKPDAPFLQPSPANGNLGYAYQWWIPSESEGAFMAMGIYGQMIYVNPRRHVVIVQTSAWKLPDEDASWAESVKAMDSVAHRIH
jgi:CubicO group peptidase (beta-lactamase class C family)